MWPVDTCLLLPKSHKLTKLNRTPSSATLNRSVTATALISHRVNRGAEHGPFRLNIPNLPWDVVVALCELKIFLNGSSARHSQQTLVARLGLLGLTSILPHHLIQLTIK